jgi:predicted nucleic acid-binding protein
MIAPISAFDKEAIYLDTMMPYALLRGIDPAIKTFFQRIERGEFQAFTSVLTFDELAYRLILALIKDHYDGSPLDNLRENEEKLISEFAQPVTIQLDQLRYFPGLTIVDLHGDDLTRMNDAIVRYSIRPRDALHYATMHRVDCLFVASNDAHFDRIPQISRFSLN